MVKKVSNGKTYFYNTKTITIDAVLLDEFRELAKQLNLRPNDVIVEMLQNWILENQENTEE